MTAPLVIQTEDLDPAPALWLAERCELVRADAGSARFHELLARTEGLVVRTYTRVDGALLARAPRLRVVGRAGVGLDTIDVPACRARAVAVVHTPDANSRAVAEFVLASVLGAIRPRPALATALPRDRWDALRRSSIAPRELGELTLGIWGLGRVGRTVARIVGPLCRCVIYHDLLDIAPEARAGASPVSRDTLLRESDVLSIHVDARPANRGLLGEPALALVKPDAVILNTSRGFVVDAHALAAFLRREPAVRAILDVHEPEPVVAANPLLGVPNAVLTPHLAAATARAHAAMSWVVRDVWRVLNGEAPEFPAPAP